MINLNSVVQAISTHLPSPLPAPPPVHVPDISALPRLAAYLSTQPEPALLARRVLEQHSDEISQISQQAGGFISAAAVDITEIAARFLSRAVPLALSALIPGPGTAHALARLTIEASSHLAQAALRIRTLSEELAPFAQRLTAIAAEHIDLPEGPGMRAPEPQLAAIPAAAPPQPEAGPEQGSSAGSAAVAAAKSALGTPYVWGGTTPNGFDCSGLTQWAWRQAGLEIPRTAEMQTVGRPVSAGDLQEGDLVVWDGHVAMYAGAGSIIEAGDPVQINPLRTSNMGMAFKGFYRPTG